MYIKINYQKLDLIYKNNLIDCSTTKYCICMFLKCPYYLFISLFVYSPWQDLMCAYAILTRSIPTAIPSSFISKSANFLGKLKRKKEYGIANKSS